MSWGFIFMTSCDKIILLAMLLLLNNSYQKSIQMEGGFSKHNRFFLPPFSWRKKINSRWKVLYGHLRYPCSLAG